MARYAGVPTSSAVVVIHGPNKGDGARSTDKGAIPVSSGGRALEYNARAGRWEGKGDIDREPTRDDAGLRERYRGLAAEGRALDYIGRMGAFEGKGADRQVDASLWDQHGPVDRDAAAREMRDAGGAFVNSLVSVDRRYAADLGIETKEDFQRLLRATWSANVREWGLIADPADIRWVAAYHTDAQNSIHCHVVTWSARGEIPPGATVPRDGTRRGKGIVQREAYRELRRGRDGRAQFLRDWRCVEARRQLGLEVDRREARRIDERARGQGYPERVSPGPSLPPEAAAKAGALLEKLRGELADGEGRLSKNYAAQATARDLMGLLERECPGYAEALAEERSLAEAKADIAGYGEGHERDEFIKKELADVDRRVANGIARACTPPKDPMPLREDLQHLDMRGVHGRANVTFSAKLLQPGDGREEGDPPEDGPVRVGLPGMRASLVELPPGDVGEISNGKARLAALDLDARYHVVDPEGRDAGSITGARLLERFGPADMPRVARANPSEALMAERERRRREREARHAGYMASRQTAPTVSRINSFSLEHGMRMGDAVRVCEDAGRLGRAAGEHGAASPEARAAASRLGASLMGSRVVDRAVRDRAEAFCRAAGRDLDPGDGAAWAALRGAAEERIGELVGAEAARGNVRAPARGDEAVRSPRGPAHAGPADGGDGALAAIAAALAGSGARDARRQRRHAPARGRA